MRHPSLIALTSLISLLASMSSSNAQWVQTNGPFGGTVSAMTAIPNTQTGGVDIFAATNGGGVYLSTDNGMHWQPRFADLKNAAVWGVTGFSKGLDASTLYAETFSGVFRTTDRGTSWQFVDGPNEQRVLGLLAVYIDTAQDTVFLASAYPFLFVSTDAGRNWASSTMPPVSRPTGFVVRPATKDSGIIRILAGTMWDGIYVSSDNGMTWTRSTLGGSIGALGASDSVIYAGANYRIYRSTDEGASWTACSNGLPIATDIAAFAFGPNAGGSSSVVALGDFSEIFLSTDNGDHWYSIRNNLRGNRLCSLTAANLNSDTTALFVGTGSGVFRSTNTGLTWDAVNQGMSACIVTALGVSSISLFAGTSGNGIFRSRDRGATWIPINNGLDSTFIETIQTFGGLVVNAVASFGNTLLAGTLAGIFRSTDEGATWTDVNNDWTRQQIRSFVKSGSATFAGGSLFFVFRSTDDGLTWTCGDTNFSSGSVMALTSANGKVFAAAMAGGAYRSTDNGTSWTKVYSPVETMDYPYSLIYASPFLFLGAGTRGILRSGDDGESWQSASSGIPADADIYTYAVSGTNIFAGTGDGLFLSADHGSNWKRVSSNELNTAIRSLAICDSDLVAGTEGAGVIWKRPLSEMIAPASVSTGAAPFHFELRQNYPNPFNPSTTIAYQLPVHNSQLTGSSMQRVKLRVYDLLGREVARLVDGYQSPGEHQVRFDARTLASGVYFYRLEAGSSMQTRKLVLLR